MAQALRVFLSRSNMGLSTFFSVFLVGLTTAMLLFMISSGLTLVFGVMRVVNFAHGALYMLGAYFGLSLQSLSLIHI